MKVGIVAPVRNGMPYLPHFVNSIVAQTYAVGIYLWVDPSDDGTGDYLVDCGDSSDPFGLRPHKIEWSGGDNRLGWHGGLNRAAELAINDGCDAIFTAAADDILHPDCIRLCVQQMQSVPGKGAPFVIPQNQQFGGGEHVEASLPDVTLKHLTRWPMMTDKALIRSGVWTAVGGYSTDVCPEGSWGCAEDWEFWIKIWKAGLQAGYRVIERPLYFVRVHPNQLGSARGQLHAETVRLIRTKHPDLPWDELSDRWPPVYWEEPKRRVR